ncbi:hypothetical protein PsorP6_013901 [Peronosclerospora sorghi]|uniref:Uncharacterized protein n=1 Tax=Peronosclerospora sorghi TaxID=230839 RepID=A0ACC0VHB2_9STRA|nr:hypothetical protein PsorP6_013901 [Peronosclerospora sorghi]
MGCIKHQRRRVRDLQGTTHYAILESVRLVKTRLKTVDFFYKRLVATSGNPTTTSNVGCSKMVLVFCRPEVSFTW